MGIQVNVGLLLVWAAVCAAVALSMVATIFAVTGGFDWAECNLLGKCAEAEAAEAGSRVETVSIVDLLRCQRERLSECERWRTREGVTVQALVSDGVFVGEGVALTAAGLQRYVALQAAGQPGLGSLYCVYQADTGAAPEQVRGLKPGASALAHAELRWEDAGGRLLLTYDAAGHPACWVGMLDGKRWTGK